MSLRQRVLGVARSMGVEPEARMLVHALRLAPGLMGVDPRVFIHTLTGLPTFVCDATSYARLSTEGEPFVIRASDLYPMLGERHEPAGTARGHYFHQDLWAAKKIFERAPAQHVDIGSRIDGFIAHLLTFMPVTIIDIRPLPDHIEGLHVIEDDATYLASIPDASLESVSSLHAVEHFGLGRYGDPIDPHAPQKAMGALARVLRPGGHLYFSVPIGRERLMFNAHRIFSPSRVLDAFGGLTLLSFAAVDEAGHLRLGVEPADFEQAVYSCGLFEFGRE
jgi:SAM-dependent methyltransferase